MTTLTCRYCSSVNRLEPEFDLLNYAVNAWQCCACNMCDWIDDDNKTMYMESLSITDEQAEENLLMQDLFVIYGVLP